MSMSFAEEYMGPWIDRDAVPQLKRDFAMTDPYIRAQMQEAEPPQTARSGEQSGRTGAAKAEYVMPPPPEMREAADRAAFERGWLMGYREAAMAQAKAPPSYDAPERHRHYRQHMWMPPSARSTEEPTATGKKREP